MKTIEEKAKAYDEAIERAKEQLDGAKVFDYDNEQIAHDIRTTVYNIFPELKESEDEKIRKGIIRNLQYLMDRSEGFVKEDLQERITWLQKQCVQKNTRKREIDDAYLQGICDAKHAIEKQGEQPIDKVELKFKVGEWITNGDYTWKIVEVKPLDYMLQSQDGNIVDDTISYVDEHFYLWSINDAKDGDVLFDITHKNILLFKELSDGWVSVYCSFHKGDNCCINFNTNYCNIYNVNFSPATKEQRDLLFQKMREAGYEWDAEKKELKKIGQNPTWSEEDEE